MKEVIQISNAVCNSNSKPNRREQTVQLDLPLSQEEPKRPAPDLSPAFEGKRDQKGWTFQQIKQVGEWFLYRKAKGGTVNFEVVRRKWRSERQIGELTMPAGWFYPSPELWGIYGFTYTSEFAARQKLRDMSERDTP